MIAVTPDLSSVRAVRFGVLHLSFEDGVSGVVNIADDLWGPAFVHARTHDGFFDVTLSPETRAPTWPGDADFAPDVLYERVSAGGETPRS